MSKSNLPTEHTVLIVLLTIVCLPSLAQEMVKFSSTLVAWLQEALKGLPESLQSAKYKCKVNWARRKGTVMM